MMTADGAPAPTSQKSKGTRRASRLADGGYRRLAATSPTHRRQCWSLAPSPDGCSMLDGCQTGMGTGKDFYMYVLAGTGKVWAGG